MTDTLAKAIYAARADDGCLPWDKLPPHAQTHWRAVAEVARAAVITERRRQIEEEGFSPEQDNAYYGGELAIAACCYLTEAVTPAEMRDADQPPVEWPWSNKWWKSTTPERDMIKAAAMVAAELDRLARMRARPDAATEASHG